MYASKIWKDCKSFCQTPCVSVGYTAWKPLPLGKDNNSIDSYVLHEMVVHLRVSQI
jgi:hypothetical protein